MKALELALGHVFGVSGSFAGIDFAGRTDPWIIRQVFARFGIEPTPGNFAKYIDGYVGALPDVLARSSARVLPGVRQLVAEAASRPDVVQGLLTGNLRRGAQAKLGFHGMWEAFPIGAFADDSEVRNELGPHALRRANQHWGIEFSGADAWIVGDTPHDIACGRAFGAKTLAVATGASSISALQAYSPDAALGDLGDTGAFWRAIGL